MAPVRCLSMMLPTIVGKPARSTITLRVWVVFAVLIDTEVDELRGVDHRVLRLVDELLVSGIGKSGNTERGSSSSEAEGSFRIS